MPWTDNIYKRPTSWWGNGRCTLLICVTDFVTFKCFIHIVTFVYSMYYCIICFFRLTFPIRMHCSIVWCNSIWRLKLIQKFINCIPTREPTFVWVKHSAVAYQASWKGGTMHTRLEEDLHIISMVIFPKSGKLSKIFDGP